MDEAKTLALVLLVSLALLGRETEGQSVRTPSPTPLCATQFALVNHACTFLPYSPMPPPAPFGPPGPPSPLELLEPEDPEWQHHHRHRHNHHHHGHKPHNPTPIEMDCCRWLREVDNVCVCDLLVHLPAFLARPAHEYTVVVTDACNITYSCSGRVRPQ